METTYSIGGTIGLRHLFCMATSVMGVLHCHSYCSPLNQLTTSSPCYTHNVVGGGRPVERHYYTMWRLHCHLVNKIFILDS